MYCCMINDLEFSKKNNAKLEGFSSVACTQNKHAGDEHDGLFNKIPDELFSDAIGLLKSTSINGEVKII